MSGTVYDRGRAKIAVVLSVISTLFLLSTAARLTLPASYVAELDLERPEDSRQAATVLPVEKLREDGAALGDAFRTVMILCAVNEESEQLSSRRVRIDGFGSTLSAQSRTIDLSHRPIIHQYRDGPHFGVRLSRAAGDEEVVVPYGDDMVLSIPANDRESNAEVFKEEEEQETVAKAEG
ncbi:hypothetical protein GW17_00048337 [Ensete ventricosum]|nr:hypothetical protein GW17_00048337 [Ensete ventricosum]